MTSDLNKSIESISYNNLNLPVQIIMYINGKKHLIDYIYAASGEKRGKIITDSEGVKTTTDYLQGFQHKEGVLQFFPHAEGYVALVDGKNFQYAYNYADHLGNVRLSYGADPANGQAVVLEENHYYPFGLKRRNYNAQQFEYAENENGVSVVLEEVQRREYQYKYNGKEFQDELGLNMYDYGARNYDPAIGRWMNMDPLADISRRWSPYNYAMDNPVYFVDPDGMLSDSFINNLMKNSNSGTTWTNNDDGTFSGSNGKTIEDEEPPVNFFANTEDQKDFNLLFANMSQKGKYKEGDGIFTVYGHGSTRHIGFNKFGKNSIFTAEKFDKIMSERSPAYANKMKNKESFTLFLFACESASEYNPGDKSIARKISEAHPNATIIGLDGFGVVSSKGEISGVSEVLGDNFNDNKGQVVGYVNGKEVFRVLYSEYMPTGPTSK